MPQLALNCHEFIKKEGLYGFCDCKGFLRLTAQEQAKAEKAIKVTANCAIYAHRTNYTRHATFCKCFFGENFTDAVPSIVEGSIILTTFFLRFVINIHDRRNALKGLD